MTAAPREQSRSTRLIAAGRRWISRYRRPLAALSAALTMTCAIAALRPPAPPRAHVLTAARDLPGGLTLSRRDLARVALPAASLPRGALRAAGQAAGRVLASPVRRGEVLTDVRLLGRALLRGYGPGLVAAPVRIADAGVVALLAPGDRVDVLAALPPDAPPSTDPLGTPPASDPPDTPPASDPPDTPPASDPPDTPPAEGPTADPPDSGATADPRPTGAGAEPANGDDPGWPGWAGRARTVVRGIRVLAIPPAHDPGDGLEPGAPGRLVLLVATPEQAATLAQAALTTRLSVTIADRTAR